MSKQLNFSFTPIAYVHSPFKQKFGIPRQSSLIDIPSIIRFTEPENQLGSLADLTRFSHFWILAVFHQHLNQPKFRVRPPRLGGNQKISVFATRSSFRPNPISQSVVKRQSIIRHDGIIDMIVSGLDLLDGTPIMDIKPYLPYVDIQPEAVCTDFTRPEKIFSVSWSQIAEEEIKKLVSYSTFEIGSLVSWISDIIAFDPRPAFKCSDDGKEYYFLFDCFDIRWHVDSSQRAEVVGVRLNV